MLRTCLKSTIAAALLFSLPIAASAETAKAVFAGGCFWSIEKGFEAVPGVVEARSGFSGGRTANPAYKEVSRGRTGHLESVEVTYDPARVSYPQLLDAYWHMIDPTAVEAQFCDFGEEYQAAIFVANDAEKRAAEASLKALQPRFSDPIATKVLPAAPFYAAEAEHQDYAKKNPVRYEAYRIGCGRDRRLAEVWGTDAVKAH
jgi:peptide-methionine (S)-S-oxide reductase